MMTIPKTSHVYRHRRFLEQLYKSALVTQQLITNASKEEIDALCESSRNLLKGTFPELTPELIKQLAPSRELFRKLACKKTSVTTKRNLLQRGGILPLLPFLSPILGSLAGGAIASLIPQ
jgi:hypothetical protein